MKAWFPLLLLWGVPVFEDAPQNSYAVGLGTVGVNYLETKPR
jgi:hypothetical protein